MSSLEQSLLKELFDYNPETGVFTWCEDRCKGKIKAGSIAGSISFYGYVVIGVNGTNYPAHRLAWVYMYGSIPKDLQIDHISGVKNDNRLSNLRLANSAEQGQNRNINSNNTSGYPGVSWSKVRNKWLASIKLNRKVLYIGVFDTPEAANDARILRKAELHTFNPTQR